MWEVSGGHTDHTLLDNSQVEDNFLVFEKEGFMLPKLALNSWAQAIAYLSLVGSWVFRYVLPCLAHMYPFFFFF